MGRCNGGTVEMSTEMQCCCTECQINREFDASEKQNAKLRAENTRIREAAQRVLKSPGWVEMRALEEALK